MAFEFVYAYAAAAARAAQSLLESGRSRAGSTWRWAEERSPASVKRAMSHRFAPAVALALLMVVPAYWVMLRGASGAGEQYRMSAEEWQVSSTWCGGSSTAVALARLLMFQSDCRPICVVLGVVRRVCMPTANDAWSVKSHACCFSVAVVISVRPQRRWLHVACSFFIAPRFRLVCTFECHPHQQAKHDLLSSKYSADVVRQRLKYDSLAGRHMELQQEYESLVKEFKNQQRTARAGRNGPKVRPGRVVAAGHGC